jgi:hypothetical protein
MGAPALGGVIHMGFGTLWRSDEEKWAGENESSTVICISICYFDVHCYHKSWKDYTIIRNGRLTALDDRRCESLPRNTAIR